MAIQQSPRVSGRSKQLGLPSSLEEEARAAQDPDEMGDVERKHLSRLKEWFNEERSRQADNRQQMAIDEDFYDGLQWTEEDAQVVQSRGQAPLVYNEVKITCDWVIGSEKRNRTDWKVLPRTDDDVTDAEVKTKVMKYISDANRVPYVRSAAFKDAVVAGLGWLEDSISPDATKDVLYAGTESWRNVLQDSLDRSVDSEGMRYVFRWRDLDLDVACAMFPDKKAQLQRSAKGEEELAAEDDAALWYLGSRLDSREVRSFHRSVMSDAVNGAFSSRQRVRLYECWYKVPAKVEALVGGGFDGETFDPQSRAHVAAVEEGRSYVVPSTTMMVRCSYFVDDCLLEDLPSPFKHNKFPFTPIYAFRRSRDGLPYGLVRNIRDPQEDLNKRMSKALFLLSVNQVITEQGAFDDKGEYTLADMADEVSKPNGVIVMKDGAKRFEVRRDYNELQGQTELVTMNRQFIQSGSGVTDELLGRRTNATSGVAIAARQDQGSLTTSGIFDNFRLAMSISGQKQLSNAEKFYTMPKVIRLADPKGRQFQWVRINQPEQQPDGSVRFLNDISASSADFVVDEQDFKASMRQAMFESLNEMITKIAPLNPTFAISMLDLLIDVADFPGKEEMLERVRMLIAEARGEGPKNPEAEAAAAEAAELEKSAAAAKIAKDEAAANKADAEADQIRMAIPRDAVAMDLSNVSQQQAVEGTTPIQPGEQAQLNAKSAGQGVMAPEAQSAPLGGFPAGPGVAPVAGVSPSAMPAAAGVMDPTAPVPPGVAASSAPLPGAVGPDIATLLAQITQTQQQLTDVAAGMAAAIDGVANAMEQTSQAVAGVAQTVDAVAASVDQTTESVANTAAEVTKAVAKVDQSTSDVAKALADSKKPQGKTIEVTGKDGKRMTAVIKPN